MDNKEVRSVLQSKGITQRLTAPYTPEQNGGSEREFRTIVEMARTLMHSNEGIKFPDSMWAELVGASTYISNRTGKSTVEGKNPYQLWLGKKPRIKHLRIIGSTCYVHIPVQRRRKMEKKAVEGYLVGYDGDERYRVWIKEENKIILSRDIVFHEKLSKCEEKVEIPMKDIEPNNQGKPSIDENSSSDEDDAQEAEEREGQDRDSDEEEFDVAPSHSMNLRDRASLKKPSIYDDYIMLSEGFMSDRETPETYQEAVQGEDRQHWQLAMKQEMQSLRDNNTWELVTLPAGARAIPCKWVYKVKTKPDGTIEKFKARVVIKGFSQRPDIDYTQI